MSRRALTWVLVAWGLWLIAAPACARDTVYYYISDSLHSEVTVTDQNRNVVEQTYYAPYGEVLNRPLRDGPGYTGHEEDPGTGLVYMQQRYYCPECGRFLSTDPVGVNPATGANFNRYAYAKDNPYRYTDPFGEYACKANPAQCSAIASGYQKIKDAQGSYRKGSTAYNRIQGVLDYLGKPGDANGVTVTVKSFNGPNQRGDNDRGTIRLDLKKIAGDANNKMYSSRNDSFKGNDLKYSMIGSLLGHEAQHGVDARSWGWPATRAQDLRTEKSAYGTEAAIQGGLHLEYGLWGNGWTPNTVQQAIQRNAESSATTFCSATPTPSGC